LKNSVACFFFKRIYISTDSWFDSPSKHLKSDTPYLSNLKVKIILGVLWSERTKD